MSNTKPAYLNVLIVEQFETGAGRTVRNWTKVGVAFPHTEGGGFNIELKAFPRDGKLVVLQPQSDERANRVSDANSAAADPARTTKAPAARDRSR
jgi:hypothetical protein